ncbi:MAG: ADP-ribosylglycohydrolase family protein [bacterium]
MPTPRERFRGCLLGLACGDAVGTRVEFLPRGAFAPITDMKGGGPFGLPPGYWTDDTSMALCLAASLIEKGRHDAHDQISRYVRWWQDGYLSSTGRCFDIGNTTRAALSRFLESGDPITGPTDPYSAGNGSIMRLAPVAMFWANDVDTAEKMAAESSRTTHGSPESVDGCRLLARMLVAALGGASKEECLAAGSGRDYSGKIASIAAGGWRSKSEDAIRGTGYVVESLEAAVWSFHHSDTFESAILRATNLGDDADTTAAVCGQIAGAFWGVEGIPESWREKIVMRDEIEGMADALGPR